MFTYLLIFVCLAGLLVWAFMPSGSKTPEDVLSCDLGERAELLDGERRVYQRAWALRVHKIKKGLPQDTSSLLRSVLNDLLTIHLDLQIAQQRLHLHFGDLNKRTALVEEEYFLKERLESQGLTPETVHQITRQRDVVQARLKVWREALERLTRIEEGLQQCESHLALIEEHAALGEPEHLEQVRDDMGTLRAATLALYQHSDELSTQERGAMPKSAPYREAVKEQAS